MEIFSIFTECGKNVEFLWKFCEVNIVESVSPFVSVENYGSFVGLINVDEISNAFAIAHARQGVFWKSLSRIKLLL